MKTDEQLQRDVLAELTWEPGIRASQIGVTTKDGVVTLTGPVTNLSQKFLAERAAKRIVGVKAVANDIEVHTVLTPSTDSDIATSVLHALKWDTTVPDDRITVTVRDGWVTLEGTVRTWYERQDAERVVARLTGVRGVTNQLRVMPVPLNAEEIRSAISEALERRAVREGRRLKVDVEDGVVTLRGTIRSWTERNAIDRVVAYAPGVKRVDDNLVVDPFS
jgi:osmotically-inducible protein OsmY